MHGTPALVHPQSGAALVLTLGTECALRLLRAVVTEAVSRGARGEEQQWCLKAFEFCG